MNNQRREIILNKLAASSEAVKNMSIRGKAPGVIAPGAMGKNGATAPITGSNPVQAIKLQKVKPWQ